MSFITRAFAKNLEGKVGRFRRTLAADLSSQTQVIGARKYELDLPKQEEKVLKFSSAISNLLDELVCSQQWETILYVVNFYLQVIETMWPDFLDLNGDRKNWSKLMDSKLSDYALTHVRIRICQLGLRARKKISDERHGELKYMEATFNPDTWKMKIENVTKQIDLRRYVPGDRRYKMIR
jgi:hypothetical protein